MIVPVLMITHNRFQFTKKALESLINSDFEARTIIDNGSDNELVDYLQEYKETYYGRVIFNKENKGIAFAMNQFLNTTSGFEYCAKVDSDTLIPPDFCARMLPHMEHCELLQAKHPIIKATNPNGWEGFTKNMKKENGLIYNHFIGGSGLMFKRSVVNHIPETEWLIGGWREFQRRNPELRKAFAPDVEIELLDSEDNGGYPEEYKEYYKQTGRIN